MAAVTSRLLFNDGYLFGDVLQLPDVARPVVVDKHLPRLAVGPDGRHAVTLCKVHGKFTEEEYYVFSPFAQRGYPHRNRVEPVEEILAEPP